jgi:deoxycytidine triphosphate deaminase
MAGEEELPWWYPPPELVDPQAERREYDPYNYWRRPSDKGLTKAYWDDPLPELQGMLTSDHIRTYHELVGRMIRPFQTARLKTTSYELSLGSRCIVEGKERFLTADNPWLEIPKNSIAFVSMQQVLLLPHYVAGRFDLAIDFIYQGLLLGTGPQVDAGFQGALSCPLHNISNNSIHMRLGEPFAKLDFVKTCTRTEEQRLEIEQIDDEIALERWASGHGPYTKLYKGGSFDWREPIFEYVGHTRPTSSVGELRRVVEQLRRYSVLGLLGVLVGAAALVFVVVQLATSQLAGKEEVRGVRACQAALQREFQQALDVVARGGSAPRLVLSDVLCEVGVTDAAPVGSRKAPRVQAENRV